MGAEDTAAVRQGGEGSKKRGRASDPRRERLAPGIFPAAPRDQLRDLSTSLFALIQGIIARSFSPTTSIWCSEVRRRRDCRVGAPARFSRMKFFAYSPVWISLSTCFIAFFVSSFTTFGPVTYSP